MTRRVPDNGAGFVVNVLLAIWFLLLPLMVICGPSGGGRFKPALPARPGVWFELERAAMIGASRRSRRAGHEQSTLSAA
jgi:hypothetical protein